MDLKNLQKKIPYKWKIQSFTKDKTKASCVAYIDARDVMDLLDEVCGIDGWSDQYIILKDELYCGITINGTIKWDCGAEITNEFVSEQAKVKGHASDAFKRASVKWGVGRFLYNLEIKWIKVNQYKQPVDDGGQRIYDLSEYFNNTKAVKQPAPAVEPKPTTKPPPKGDEQSQKCDNCPEIVQPNVVQFCKNHAGQFNNKILCFNCQKGAK